MIIFELDKNCKEVWLDGPLKIVEKNIEGDIFGTIYKELVKINNERFEKRLKEVNTIAMSPHLYSYLRYLVGDRQICLDASIRRNIKQIFGLNMVIRDDYEINQIDIYRDVTNDF